MPEFNKLSVLLTLSCFLLEAAAVSAQGGPSSASLEGDDVIGGDDAATSVVRLKETSRQRILAGSQEDSGPLLDDGQWYWLEIKAIIGGVLGFWGGVGSLGTLFLVIVLSQRYCCKKTDDKDDGAG
eukprot:TRINITY_DN256_c3_g1_i1.p1 TRINITY_DN256_c3_g1~~TRINITY_DN256_c3_g1_i1.p1  ORF type:complete len:126 (-),score=40.20 TRINITY_DN256_c3_g1_i1:240-617(-)